MVIDRARTETGACFSCIHPWETKMHTVIAMVTGPPTNRRLYFFIFSATDAVLKSICRIGYYNIGGSLAIDRRRPTSLGLRLVQIPRRLTLDRPYLRLVLSKLHRIRCGVTIILPKESEENAPSIGLSRVPRTGVPVLSAAGRQPDILTNIIIQIVDARP